MLLKNNFFFFFLPPSPQSGWTSPKGDKNNSGAWERLCYPGTALGLLSDDPSYGGCDFLSVISPRSLLRKTSSSRSCSHRHSLLVLGGWHTSADPWEGELVCRFLRAPCTVPVVCFMTEGTVIHMSCLSTKMFLTPQSPFLKQK